MFKPMLATDAGATIQYPKLASPKLDGVRAIVRGGTVYSRSNKPIPNPEVQAKFGHLEYFDGELIVGKPTNPSVYRDTVSVVMSYDKPATDVHFHAFDYIADLKLPYEERRGNLHTKHIDTKTNTTDVHIVGQTFIKDEDSLLAYEKMRLEEGYEGVMLRGILSPYKQGRSTAKEGYLLKVKRFVDDEAEVIGFEERKHNTNEATTNELGRTQRSSHQSGLVGMNTLGALILRAPEGVQFGCGTGFTDEERAEIWANRGKYLGKLAKYKHFTVGVKIAPRHPVFIGWRDRSDT